LEHPDFPGEAAVQQVYLAAYLPQELVVLGSEGPWTEEYTWTLDPGGQWRPRPKMDENGLLAWVAGGQSVNPSEKFPTDGRMVLFSALRPVAPEEGSLELHLLKGKWLHGLVFAVVVLGGVLLWPARAASRAVAVGGLVIALVLCGVFAPTFSRQVLNSVLAAAIAVVVVIWLVEYWRHRPQRPAAVSPPAVPPGPAPTPPLQVPAQAAPPASPPPPPEPPAASQPASDSQEGE
jgi:hypothetical protein